MPPNAQKGKRGTLVPWNERAAGITNMLEQHSPPDDDDSLESHEPLSDYISSEEQSFRRLKRMKTDS